MWFNNYFISLFTKLGWDVSRTIHFYEACLATLAIVVWHFYFVILNPDVYPMITTWLPTVHFKTGNGRGTSVGIRTNKKRNDGLKIAAVPFLNLSFAIATLPVHNTETVCTEIHTQFLPDCLAL